ncbi:FMN-binding protein, partial [bacterium]|nr:FMN-binding protein [bacterium]MCG2677527.1 FMN-binding protein [bacterium]
IMMGVNPEDNSITGIEILEHMETPGLGANIEKGEFKNQFKEKSLANSKLVDGKLAVKKNKGDIEALTGATISSRGVTEAVDKGLKVFLKYKEEILGEKKPEVTDG